MNKPTHLIFGEIIWKYLDENYGITLNRAGFLLGNIAPDLTFSFVFHPHERKYASEHLRYAIDAAIKAGDIMDIFRKIEEMNDAYLAGRPSYRAQAEGALSACLQTVGTIMTTRYYAAFNVEPGFLVH